MAINVKSLILFVPLLHVLTWYVVTSGTKLPPDKKSPQKLNKMFLDDNDFKEMNPNMLRHFSLRPGIDWNQTNINQLNELKQLVDSHVKRLTNLFLQVSNLNKYENPSESIIFSVINVEIAKSDLLTLQLMANGSSPIVLSQLERILYKSLSYSHLNAAKSYFMSIVNYFTTSLQWPGDVPLEIVFLLFAFGLLWRYCGLKTAICFILLAFCVVDSLRTYRIELKKAEIKQYLKMKEATSTVNERCDPNSRSWWQSFSYMFKGNPCVELYLAAEMNYVESVSFVDILFDTFLVKFFALPMKHFGEIVRSMAAQLSDHYGPILGYALYPFIAAVVLIILSIAILIACGSSLRVSSLLGSIHFGRNSTPVAAKSDHCENDSRNVSQPTVSSATNFPNININITMPKLKKIRRKSTKSEVLSNVIQRKALTVLDESSDTDGCSSDQENIAPAANEEEINSENINNSDDSNDSSEDFKITQDLNVVKKALAKYNKNNRD